MVTVLDVGPGGDPKGGLKRGAEAILRGGVVAFPTESFYGLGADPRDETAVRRIFRIKRRRDDHPLLILIPSREALDHYALSVPETARALMDRFWPGGLTLVFEARPALSSLLTAGTGKVGVRLSSHAVATGLCREAGTAVTGTSANYAGMPPCRNAGGVLETLGPELDLILDGGETPGGKGSTVLDVTTDPPQLIREGIVRRGDLGL